MEVETSAYQGFKLWLAGYVPLDRNTLHYLVGAALVSVALIRLRKQPRTRPLAVALVVAFILGVAMEIADMRDDVATLGYWRWPASLLDLGRTIAVPVGAYILARWLLKWPATSRDHGSRR